MFGKNIYSEEVPSFPEISDDYFNIKDENINQELMDLYKQSQDLLPISGQMSAEFRQKQQGLLDVFNQLDQKFKDTVNCKPDIFEPENIDFSIRTPFQNFDYYNLSNITYDQGEAAMEAAKFLPGINEKFSQMQIEGKQKKYNQKQHLVKKMELLSFQDND